MHTKYKWSLPISSYQMERVALNHSARLCLLPYDQALHQLFAVLLNSDPESLLDRTGLRSTFVDPFDDRAGNAQKALASCWKISKDALAASAAADDRRSIAAWNQVFRGCVPE